MWAAFAVVLSILLIASGVANVLLVKRLLQFQLVFEKVDEFVSLIYSYTCKFEGKALLSDSQEAIYFHKLITLTREFFRGFELEERPKEEQVDG